MQKYLFLLFLISTGNLAAQTIVNRDPAIMQMVNEVSPDSLQSYIKKMVAFGTRNTLSTQTDPLRGIGAARTWVLNKFLSFGKNAKGRMSAIIDTTTLQPDGRRVDTSLLLGNVIATLKGTDPKDKRIFLISGHLDNMRTNVMDRTGDA
ncbi:MAG: peptidase M28, partial [Chitinophagaceae bacterium]